MKSKKNKSWMKFLTDYDLMTDYSKPRVRYISESNSETAIEALQELERANYIRPYMKKSIKSIADYDTADEFFSEILKQAIINEDVATIKYLIPTYDIIVGEKELEYAKSTGNLMIYKFLEASKVLHDDNNVEEIEEDMAVSDTLAHVGYAIDKKIDDTKESIKNKVKNFRNRKDPAVVGRKEYIKKQKLRKKQGLDSYGI